MSNQDSTDPSTISSLTLLEKDRNNEVMITWAFPKVEQELRQLLVEKSYLSLEVIPLQFSFSKYGANWFYVYSRVLESEPAAEGAAPSALPAVTAFSLVLQSTSYHPEAFAALLHQLAQQYALRGSPPELLASLLGVITTGSASFADASFALSEYSVRRCLLATSLKDLLRMFGLECVLVWSALLLRKRVLVYCENPAILLRVVRGLPLFVWHRQDWGLMRPLVDATELQLAELRGSGAFIAGTTSEALKGQDDLYDLLVDVNQREITFPEHAAGEFRLGAFHKELAMFMAAAGEDEEMTDVRLLKELTGRTKDFIAKVDSLRVEDGDGHRVVTHESIRQVKMPQNMELFIYQVASAEGMT